MTDAICPWELPTSSVASCSKAWLNRNKCDAMAPAIIAMRCLIQAWKAASWRLPSRPFPDRPYLVTTQPRGKGGLEARPEPAPSGAEPAWMPPSLRGCAIAQIRPVRLPRYGLSGKGNGFLQLLTSHPTCAGSAPPGCRPSPAWQRPSRPATTT